MNSCAMSCLGNLIIKVLFLFANLLGMIAINQKEPKLVSLSGLIYNFFPAFCMLLFSIALRTKFDSIIIIIIVIAHVFWIFNHLQ